MPPVYLREREHRVRLAGSVIPELFNASVSMSIGSNGASTGKNGGSAGVSMNSGFMTNIGNTGLRYSLPYNDITTDGNVATPAEAAYIGCAVSFDNTSGVMYTPSVLRAQTTGAATFLATANTTDSLANHSMSNTPRLPFRLQLQSFATPVPVAKGKYLRAWPSIVSGSEWSNSAIASDSDTYSDIDGNYAHSEVTVEVANRIRLHQCPIMRPISGYKLWKKMADLTYQLQNTAYLSVTFYPTREYFAPCSYAEYLLRPQFSGYVSVFGSGIVNGDLFESMINILADKFSVDYPTDNIEVLADSMLYGGMVGVTSYGQVTATGSSNATSTTTTATASSAANASFFNPPSTYPDRALNTMSNWIVP